MRGIVIKVSTKGGFGFLEPSDGSPDAFFHRGALSGLFSEALVGRAAEFDLVSSDRGPRAVSVKLVEAAGDERIQEI